MRLLIFFILILFFTNNSFGRFWEKADSNYRTVYYHITAYDSLTYAVAGSHNYIDTNDKIIFDSFINITYDYGKSWKTIWKAVVDLEKFQNPPGVKRIEFLSKNEIIACLFGGLIIRSSDAGFSWDSTYIKGTNWPNSMCFYQSKFGVVNYLFENSYYLTDDSGRTWYEQPLPYDMPKIEYGYTIRDAYRLGSDTIIFSCNKPTVFIESWTMRSVDKGKTWEIFDNIAEYSPNQYFLNSTVGFAGGFKEFDINEIPVIYKTIDGGKNWNRIWQWDSFNSIPQSIVVVGNTILASTWGYILRSPDYGTTWEIDTDNRNEYSYFRWIASLNVNYALAITIDDFIFRLTEETSIENQIKSSDLIISPNPSSGRINIKFSIEGTSEFVKIQLYDNLGQLVNTLVDKEYSQGDYNESYNSSGLSPGIYYISTSIGHEKSNKKFIVIK